MNAQADRPVETRGFQGAICASMAAIVGLPRAAFSAQRNLVRPFPLSTVRPGPSPWLRAVEANRGYLHRLEPDRLLHGYRPARIGCRILAERPLR